MTLEEFITRDDILLLLVLLHLLGVVLQDQDLPKHLALPLMLLLPRKRLYLVVDLLAEVSVEMDTVVPGAEVSVVSGTVVIRVAPEVEEEGRTLLFLQVVQEDVEMYCGLL